MYALPDGLGVAHPPNSDKLLSLKHDIPAFFGYRTIGD